MNDEKMAQKNSNTKSSAELKPSASDSVLQSVVRALIELLNKKPMSGISVQELAHCAGISRMTYYRYFSSFEDILIQYLAYLTDRFKKEVLSGVRFGSFIRAENIELGFRYFAENREFVLCLLRNNMGDLIRQNMIREELNLSYTSQTSSEEYYLTVAYASTLFGVYSKWLTDGMKEDTEKLTKMILDLFQAKLRRY
ncbi:MAG: TetR/AcrR family transcriptional regulator C-terminal domain-containing protein [Eubacteriales bacterium]|jgi:AcrR family transcriptional regulator